MVNIRSFKYQGQKFSSWLYRIATNEINMYFRQHSQSVRHVSLSSGALEDLFKETETEVSPDVLDHLTKLLAELSFDEVQLIEWRFYEERSFREMGYLLDVTEANAKVRTYRLLDKIKKLLPKA